MDYEMGRTCNTYGRPDVHTKFQSEDLKKKDYIQDRGTNQMIILNGLQRIIMWRYVLDLSDSVKWRAVVNTAMNLRVP
jgi:hypothetical protein